MNRFFLALSLLLTNCGESSGRGAMRANIVMVLLVTLFCFSSCTTTSQHGSKINGVLYLDNPESYLENCSNLGNYQGVAASVWGGKIGNSQARIDAIKNAKADGATHFVESDANWADGGVSGTGYKCP
jgi:hypothetical protein